MKKVEREYKIFKKEVERKQEIAIMLESIRILGKYLPDEEVKADHFYYSRYAHDYLPVVIDIAHNSFYKSFYKMLPELIENNFEIILGNTDIDGLDNWLKTADIDSKKRNELKKDYYNMRTSFSELEYSVGDKRILSVNLLDWLVKNNMYEVLVNLLVSEEVTLEQKFTILDKALCESNEKFDAILSTLPSTYMMDEYHATVIKESFNELLAKNLQEVYADKKEYLKRMVAINIRESIADRSSKIYADRVIKSLIKFGLVDMNEITFNYNGTEITTAVALDVMDRHNLAIYLYNLPEYTKTDSKLRCQSDKVLLKLTIHKSKKGIIEIINRENYTNTSETALYLLDEIDKSNSSTNECHYTQEDIDEIVDILLENKKTKKEEYKKIKRALVDRKKNEELLVQKRQELTLALANLNDYLLNNEPAKKKIKEIEFSKK